MVCRSQAMFQTLLSRWHVPSAVTQGSQTGLLEVDCIMTCWIGNLLTDDVNKIPCDGLQDLQAVSQSSLSQVYSSLIPQVAFQISFDSIAASTAQVSQVRPRLTARCASAATVHH